jgi:hypothetical protein
MRRIATLLMVVLIGSVAWSPPATAAVPALPGSGSVSGRGALVGNQTCDGYFFVSNGEFFSGRNPFMGRRARYEFRACIPLGGGVSIDPNAPASGTFTIRTDSRAVLQGTISGRGSWPSQAIIDYQLRLNVTNSSGAPTPLRGFIDISVTAQFGQELQSVDTGTFASNVTPA